MLIQPIHLTRAIKQLIEAMSHELPPLQNGDTAATFMYAQLRFFADKCQAIGMTNEAAVLRSAAECVDVGMLDADAELALADPKRAAAMLAADINLAASSLMAIHGSGADLDGIVNDFIESRLSHIHLDGRLRAEDPPYAVEQDFARWLPARGHA